MVRAGPETSRTETRMRFESVLDRPKLRAFMIGHDVALSTIVYTSGVGSALAWGRNPCRFGTRWR